MKIALIGGHLSPALALLEKLPADWQVTFIGRKYTFEGDTGVSLEYTVMKERGITFIPLTTGRLQRRLTRHSLKSISKFPYGYMQAFSILLRKRPDVIVGFGGYLSVPVCLAARTLRIPVIIHEQTMEAGMANKFISRFARYICISWESSSTFFPTKKTILTGNLIRQEILALVGKNKMSDSSEQLPTIYITGGSGGSHKINLLVEAILPQLLSIAHVIHQTGDSHQFDDYNRLTTVKNELPARLKENYTVVKFVPPQDVGEIYMSASMVIGRSGVNSVSELLLLEKPSILIPLMSGQTNEQMTNAVYLEQTGLATILREDQLTQAIFLSKIQEMLEHLSDYKIKKDVNTTKHIHAAETLIQLILSAYEKKQHQKS